LRRLDVYHVRTATRITAIIWVKQHPVMTRKDFMSNHEWCFCGWLEGAGHDFFGPNSAIDVWSVKKVTPDCAIRFRVLLE
jgi:hypothetical protein